MSEDKPIGSFFCINSRCYTKGSLLYLNTYCQNYYEVLLNTITLVKNVFSLVKKVLNTKVYIGSY